MIELNGVSAGYDGRNVAQEVTLSAQAGVFTVLTGPNGCGKSTIMRVAAGLARPAAGRVLLDGRDMAGMARNERARKLAYLPQTRDVPDISVGELALCGRFPYAGRPCRYSRADHEIAAEALNEMGIYGLRDRPLASVSGGERQKAYIAMSLAQQAGTILLDEPTTFLDIRHRIELMEMLHGLCAKGCAVLAVLHDLELALEYGDNVAVMSRGRLTGCGRPGENELDEAVESAFGVRVLRFADGAATRYAFAASAHRADR